MVSLQANMQVHDDLAALFSRNLTLSNYDVSTVHHQQQSPPPPQQEQQQQKADDQLQSQPPNDAVSESTSLAAATAEQPPIVYSISQHYHHSGHIARQPSQMQIEQEQLNANQQSQGASLPLPASEPPSDTMEMLLAANGIDPTALSPPQVQLFRIADESQRQRLLELWRICPPDGGADSPALAWSSTTLEREEMLAQIRFERLQNVQQTQQLLGQQHLRRQQQQAFHLRQQWASAMSLDGTAVPTTPAQQQNSDGRWVPYEHTEPYMMSGYDELMRSERKREEEAQARAQGAYSPFGTYRQATDPVYQSGATAHDWQAKMEMEMQMQMENQYGAFEQFRGQAGTADAMDVL